MNHNENFTVNNNNLTIHFIGDIYCDIIAKNVSSLPAWGEDRLSSIEISPGGSCLNSIVHAKSFSRYLNSNNNSNINLEIFSGVGHDSQGDICINKLKNDGIGTNIKRFEHTASCIVISGHTDRCFISDRSCVSQLSLDWFDINHLSSCNLIHCGGFYNCEKLQDEIPALFKQMRLKGIITSLNPQYDATLIWEKIKPICPHLTFLICNEIESISISKQSNYELAAKELINWGCEHVVVTLGKDGAVCYKKDKSTNQIIKYLTLGYKINDVVDTTGAGDAFAGGFLVSWLYSKDIQFSLNHACLCGSAATTTYGGSNPSVNAIIELIKQNVQTEVSTID